MDALPLVWAVAQSVFDMMVVLYLLINRSPRRTGAESSGLRPVQLPAPSRQAKRAAARSSKKLAQRTPQPRLPETGEQSSRSARLTRKEEQPATQLHDALNLRLPRIKVSKNKPAIPVARPGQKGKEL